MKRHNEVSLCAVVRGDGTGLEEWLQLVSPHVAEIFLFDAGCKRAPLKSAAAASDKVTVFRPPPPRQDEPLAFFRRAVSYPYVLLFNPDHRVLNSFWTELPGFIKLLESGKYDEIRLRTLDCSLTDIGEIEAACTSRESAEKVLTDKKKRESVLVRWEALKKPKRERKAFKAGAPVLKIPEQFGPTPKLAVSLLVHEAPDVVEDQIKNLQRFLNDPIIALHVNKRFLESGGFDAARFKNMPSVRINPEHIDTHWGGTGVPLAMVSNCKFLLEAAEFDYLILESSNDLYVRRGAADFVRRFDSGCQQIPLPFDKGDHTHAARRDRGLASLREKLGGAAAYASAHEGTFYRRELMEEMAPLLDLHMREDIRPMTRMGDPEGDYAKEEFYFPTAAAALSGSVGTPLIYRDFCTVPSLPLEVAKAVAEENWDSAPQNARGAFGVKRIARVLDDPVREFIRELR